MQPSSSQESAKPGSRARLAKLRKAIEAQDVSTPIYGLFTLAILYTLFLASEILLPMVFALLLSLLLAPAVNLALKRWRIPRPVSALVLVVGFLVGLAGVGYGVFAPLTQWAEDAPRAVESLLQGRSELQQDLEKLRQAAQDIQAEVEDEADVDNEPQIVVHESELWQNRFATQVQSAVTGLGLSLALTYFILVSGDVLVRNLAAQMQRRRRHIFLRIVRSGQEQIARYLGVITSVNIGIGVAIGLVSWAVGLPTPVLWGLVAGLVRFIPYIGAILGVGLLLVVSAVTFDELWKVLVVPGSFMLLISVIGFFLEPYIHGQRLAVNPIIIFVSIFFWGWLWGPVGVLLAVPVMTVIMVVISHIPSLRSLAEVLRK